jgi:hypothetical protein
MNKYLRHALIRWLAPMGAAVLLFLLVQPTLAQVAGGQAELIEFLNTGEVEVGSETVGGYQQVYYVYQGNKKFVTEGNRNSAGAVGSGEYMAWETAIQGAGQVFLYHVPSDTTTQVTYDSTNLAPRISDGRIVWERWVGDRWQVFLFDGLRVKQLTEGDLAVNPTIDGNVVAFARRDAAGQWRAIRYDLLNSSAQEVGTGLEAKFAKAVAGDVVLEGQVASARIEKNIFEQPEATPTPEDLEPLSPSLTVELDEPDKVLITEISPALEPVTAEDILEELGEPEVVPEVEIVDTQELSPSPEVLAEPTAEDLSEEAVEPTVEP